MDEEVVRMIIQDYADLKKLLLQIEDDDDDDKPKKKKTNHLTHIQALELLKRLERDGQQSSKYYDDVKRQALATS